MMNNRRFVPTAAQIDWHRSKIELGRISKNKQVMLILENGYMYLIDTAAKTVQHMAGDKSDGYHDGTTVCFNILGYSMREMH